MMPEQESPRATPDASTPASPNSNVSRLLELARQAFTQKRTKNCLDLTRAILRIDPDNAEAQMMQASIRIEMHIELEHARALLRDAGLKDNPEKYTQAGKAILNKILSLDPDSQEAKTLLAEAGFPQSPPAVVPVAATAEPAHVPAVVPEDVAEASEPVAETAAPALPRTENRQWLARALLVILVALVGVGLPMFRSQPDATAPSPAGEKRASPPDAGAEPASDATPMDVVDPPLVDAHADAEAGRAADPRAPAPVRSIPPVAPPDDAAPVVLAPSGTLAVSSPAPIDIYILGQHIGSTPVTLEMSAGMHTVEYRYGDLRKIVTHVVNSNETTRATITFDVTIQINAKPWANVFIDGPERKFLGQTPLSGVQIPIGAVLVFENPKFQTKKHRVTGKDPDVQITFP